MNLHAINPENKIFLLSGTNNNDGEPIHYFIEAPNWDEANRVYDVIDRVQDDGHIRYVDIAEILPTWILTVDQAIKNIKEDYWDIFETDEPEEAP